jgi:hypothetical protein
MDGLLIPLKEYGFIGLVIGIVFFILWRMIVWVMEFVKIQHEQHVEERKGWQSLLTSLNANILHVSQSMDEHDKRADERGKYIREEHKEMIQVLGRINGYKL